MCLSIFPHLSESAGWALPPPAVDGHQHCTAARIHHGLFGELDNLTPRFGVCVELGHLERRFGFREAGEASHFVEFQTFEVDSLISVINVRRLTSLGANFVKWTGFFTQKAGTVAQIWNYRMISTLNFREFSNSCKNRGSDCNAVATWTVGWSWKMKDSHRHPLKPSPNDDSFMVASHCSRWSIRTGAARQRRKI